MADEKNVAEGFAARAVDLFKDGFNCAEAVTAAVAEHVEPGQRCFPRVATCFGAGIGRRGDFCGALAGALMVVGLRKGRDTGEDSEAKERAYRLADYVVEAFQNRFGDVSCRELTGFNLSDPAGIEAYRREEVHDKLCVVFVAEAVRLAYDAIKS
ncbi:MAG: hypothetical protein GTN49_08735 [candidate division Zixibacteria bacterium]|nr:hypothetical protein [candidate division Zixibacteria bacterium]